MCLHFLYSADVANSKLGYSNFTHLEPWEPLTHSNGEWDPRSAKDTFARITVLRSNKLLASKRPTSFFYFIFIYLLDNFIIIIFISIFCFSVTKKVSHLHERLSLMSNLVFGYLPLFQISNCNSTIPFEL